MSYLGELLRAWWHRQRVLWRLRRMQKDQERLERWQEHQLKEDWLGR